MRSASLSYVMQLTKARWKLGTGISKAINDGKKSVTTRYLQLKSSHAVAGEYLLRTKQAQVHVAGGLITVDRLSPTY
jgi:hypothetical protein